MNIFKKKTMSQRVLREVNKTANRAMKQAEDQPLQVPVAIAASIYIVKETVHGAMIVTDLAAIPVVALSKSFGTAYKILKIKSKKWTAYLDGAITSALQKELT